MTYAEVSAEIAEGTQRLAHILAARQLSEEQWNEISIRWLQRMGDDVKEHGENATLPMVFSNAFAAAQASGLPPKVVPWSPIWMVSAIAAVTMKAATGKPPPSPLPSVMMSGTTPSCSTPTC